MALSPAFLYDVGGGHRRQFAACARKGRIGVEFDRFFHVSGQIAPVSASEVSDGHERRISVALVVQRLVQLFLQLGRPILIPCHNSERSGYFTYLSSPTHIVKRNGSPGEADLRLPNSTSRAFRTSALSRMPSRDV